MGGLADAMTPIVSQTLLETRTDYQLICSLLSAQGSFQYEGRKLTILRPTASVKRLPSLPTCGSDFGIARLSTASLQPNRDVSELLPESFEAKTDGVLKPISLADDGSGKRTLQRPEQVLTWLQAETSSGSGYAYDIPFNVDTARRFNALLIKPQQPMSIVTPTLALTRLTHGLPRFSIPHRDDNGVAVAHTLLAASVASTARPSKVWLFPAPQQEAQFLNSMSILESLRFTSTLAVQEVGDTVLCGPDMPHATISYVDSMNLVVMSSCVHILWPTGQTLLDLPPHKVKHVQALVEHLALTNG